MWNSIKLYLVGAFTQNLGTKAAAFLIAAALFITIRVGEKAERRVYVDVAIQTPDPQTGKVVVGSIIDRVKLTVRGPRSMMNTMLKPGSVRPVVVDLRSFAGGTYYFDEAMFQVPTGFEIVQISPPSIAVGIDTLSEKKVDVQPSLSGQVANDFRLIQPFIVQPPRLTIVGPAGLLGETHKVETEPISVEGLTEGAYTRRVRVQRPSADIEIQPSLEVQVQFSVEPVLEDRRFDDLPVKVVASEKAPIATVLPARVSITLSGTKRRLGNVNPDILLLFVSLVPEEEARGGVFRKDVKLTGLPQGVTLKGVEPSQVVVRLARRKPLP